MLFPYHSWWRNWSSTALARRKGTCDDVQLGSWKREGIQSRRMKELKPDWSKRCCFREGVALCFLQRFVEAANAFLRRSKAKRSGMSSVPLLPTFLKDDVPLFPTFLNDDV
ncbi:unnamed protein product [Brassica napus]|uniref:(rape) hypothetical protein n=1 Tax=Brassica napus TaxID=3708 RepID=A0A816W9Z9_BRANA|nr:unnamed protein product [Brassica napus]